MSAEKQSSDWRTQIEESLASFLKVAQLAGEPICPDEIAVQYHPAPHRPLAKLPVRTMAIYGFWGDGCWLKIGKVGANSNSRYTSQHYDHKSRSTSTLAKWLCVSHGRYPISEFDPDAPGDWIKASTHRVNILISSKHSKELLSLFEAFLHVRLKPRYEGYDPERSRLMKARMSEP